MRHVVLHGDGLVERPKRHHVQNRRKGFSLHDGPSVFRANDRGLHKVAGPIEHVPAAEDLAAILLNFLDRRAVCLDGLLVDEGAHQDIGFQRVPDMDLRVGLHEFADQLIIARLVDDQASGRCAALPGGPDGAEQDGADRHV